jgi:hypothetical protein|tara:strand:+ start:26298 stop:26537 length:240 start_codon:yes stop_codon:yes gene_type:complete
MKSKNIPENIKDKSLEDLQKEITKTVVELEKEENLKNSVDKYQQLLQLNNFIENKFKDKAKSISSKTYKFLNKISKEVD